jgi:hypothetical protein
MNGYYDNIDVKTLENESPCIMAYKDRYTKILFMNLIAGSKIDIPATKGPKFIKVVSGLGLAIGDDVKAIKAGMIFIVGPNEDVNIDSVLDMKIYIIVLLSDGEDETPTSQSSQNPRIWGDLPTELHGEIYFQGDVKKYISRCLLNKTHLAKCMSPNHWFKYMESLSMEDVYYIIKFTSQYISEYPELFIGILEKFIEIFDVEIKEITKTFIAPKDNINLAMFRGKGKGKAKTVSKINDNGKLPTILETHYNTMRNIKSIVASVLKGMVSVSYTQEKYGPMDNILESYLYKNYRKVYLLSERFRDFKADENDAKLVFIENFVDNIKIIDNPLNDGIINLAEIAQKIQDPDAEISDETYVDFEHQFEQYINNNFKTKDQLNAAKFLTSRVINDDTRNIIIDNIIEYYE